MGASYLYSVPIRALSRCLPSSTRLVDSSSIHRSSALHCWSARTDWCTTIDRHLIASREGTLKQHLAAVCTDCTDDWWKAIVSRLVVSREETAPCCRLMHGRTGGKAIGRRLIASCGRIGSLFQILVLVALRDARSLRCPCCLLPPVCDRPRNLLGHVCTDDHLMTDSCSSHLVISLNPLGFWTPIASNVPFN